MSDGGFGDGGFGDGAGGPSVIPEGLDATLVLLRHGETEWILRGLFQGQGETSLSDAGRRQAELAGARLARPLASPALPVPGGRPLEVVHSPLQRTTETARAVAEAIRAEAAATGEDASGMVVRPDAGLLEIGQGEWEGVHQDEIARRWPDVLSAWRRRPWEMHAPGGESLDAVQARLRPALAGVLERLGRDYPRGTLDRSSVHGYPGVSVHQDQPWSVLVGHDGVFKVAMLTLFGLPLTHFWMFTLALTGMTVIELRGGRPIVRAANLTEHLAPLLDERALAAAEERARTGAF